MPVAAQKTRIVAGDFHLSAKANQIGFTVDAPAKKVTVFTDTADTYIAGKSTSTLSVNGFYDFADHADLTSWESAGAQAVTVGLSGLAVGAEVTLASSLVTSFQTSSGGDEAVAFTLAAQTDGFTTVGVSLHDLAAETADGSAASVDGGSASTTGAYAHLHVTDYSGLDSAVVTIEDSANNATWATIGTFTTVTAVTAERITIAGTVRQYVRATIDVTGTGSITYTVALART